MITFSWLIKTFYRWSLFCSIKRHRFCLFIQICNVMNNEAISLWRLNRMIQSVTKRNNRSVSVDLVRFVFDHCRAINRVTISLLCQVSFTIRPHRFSFVSLTKCCKPASMFHYSKPTLRNFFKSDCWTIVNCDVS